MPNVADMTGIYAQVGETSQWVHEALVSWTRRRLRDSRLNELEVYGRFLPDGSSVPHLVLFPYRIGPDPKIHETSPGVNLVQTGRMFPQQRGTPSSVLLPNVWQRLSNALTEALQALYEELRIKHRVQSSKELLLGQPIPDPFLPPPLRAWFEHNSVDSESQTEEDFEEDPPWQSQLRLVRGDTVNWVPPSLWWHPGFVLSFHYLALAQDTGRGVQSATSHQSSLAVPALSILASAIERERILRLQLSPRPLLPALASWLLALSDSLPSDHPAASALRSACKATEAPYWLELGLEPVYDLNTNDFALLMQALQKPLQPALNLRLRLRLADGPILGSSAVPRFQTRVWPQKTEDGLASPASVEDSP